MELALLHHQLPPPTFSAVFAIGPAQLSLFSFLTTPELLLLRCDEETKEWVEAFTRHERRVRNVDVAAGCHVPVLRYLTTPCDALDCEHCGQRCVISERADGDYQHGWHCDAKLACSGEWHAPGAERWCCMTCVEDGCFECCPRDTMAGIALEDSTVRLAMGEYDLGEGACLNLETEGMRLLGEEGVVITRAADRQFAVQTSAEGVVIEKVAVRCFAEHNAAVDVAAGSATVKDCDMNGQVVVGEGAKLLLQKCTVRNCLSCAVGVHGTADIQNCIIEDGPGNGILVKPTGEITVTGTTMRRCKTGLFVLGKATIGKATIRSCSITGCTQSGAFAWKTESGPGEVTAEEGADLVCSGNNTSDHEWHGDFVAAEGGTIKGVAEEKIKSI